MPAHGARKHDLLQIAAFAHHLFESNRSRPLFQVVVAVQNAAVVFDEECKIAANEPLRARRIGVLSSKTAVFCICPSALSLYILSGESLGYG
jgi:hypothetical protein